MGGAKGVPHSHHGMSQTRLYRVWISMLSRCGHRKCSNPLAFKYYIDRGIVVCEAWQKFTVFAEWALANGYSEGMTIDRLNPTLNYEPANCQWVSMATNLRRRAGVKLTMEKARAIRARKAGGERALNLAYEYGVQPNQIYRVCRGMRWSEDVA